MRTLFAILFVLSSLLLNAQAVKKQDLTLDRIFNSNEFRQAYLQPFQWTNGGNSYVRIEYNENKQQVLAKYDTKSQSRTIILPATDLKTDNQTIHIESFTFSSDESKLLIFANSSRVWRTNTKGDYWIYDFETKRLKQIGTKFPASSLMFAKFSGDHSKVAYVQNFNIYVEDLNSGEISQLTKDGGNGIINGTFDWVYEEEFGCNDGFSWNGSGNKIAFWHLDASTTGTFYMIDNLDSIYAQLIPLQYPKVGQTPSACKVGIISTNDGKTHWIPIEGSATENYLPGMQWVNDKMLLIQQLNRHQNRLTIWSYNTTTETLKKVYTETESTWVALQYPDVSASWWAGNAMKLVDNNRAFLRLSENDGWRHIYKIDIETGEKTVLTKGAYDVASLVQTTDKQVYFHASPNNSTQRYLYRVALNGRSKATLVTPEQFKGISHYALSPNGQYGIHKFSSATEPPIVDLISLPKHKTVSHLVDNQLYKEKIATIDFPNIEFFKVTTEEGVEIDGRMIQPINFDSTKKYPVLFHVYGEPWGQVATDNWGDLWNVYLAQQGYIVIDMDNRGTPCLKGSDWRKSIYRKIGVLNTKDQALAAKEVLKWPFIDSDMVTVWGWSGGGSMTLNLLFQYPEIYKTGMAVAAVSNQLIYDNVYQERYMGLPQENRVDFVNGSPITYAKNLEGNLLIVHGTHDDNVHYQSMEQLVDVLITENKQFTMMSYPNRSHGLYERSNTRRHLYTLLTNYLMMHNPTGEK